MTDPYTPPPQATPEMLRFIRKLPKHMRQRVEDISPQHQEELLRFYKRSCKSTGTAYLLGGLGGLHYLYLGNYFKQVFLWLLLSAPVWLYVAGHPPVVTAMRQWSDVSQQMQSGDITRLMESAPAISSTMDKLMKDRMVMVTLVLHGWGMFWLLADMLRIPTFVKDYNLSRIEQFFLKTGIAFQPRKLKKGDEEEGDVFDSSGTDPSLFDPGRYGAEVKPAKKSILNLGKHTQGHVATQHKDPSSPFYTPPPEHITEFETGKYRDEAEGKNKPVKLGDLLRKMPKK